VQNPTSCFRFPSSLLSDFPVWLAGNKKRLTPTTKKTIKMPTEASKKQKPFLNSGVFAGTGANF